MNTANIPTKEQLRERFAKELNITHLTLPEQDEVINELSKIIIERISLELMTHLPKQEVENVDRLITEGVISEVETLIHKHIPNAQKKIEYITMYALAEFKSYTNA